MSAYERERKKARELYLNSGGSLTITEIARRIGRPVTTVYGWKRRERWDRQLGTPDRDHKQVPIILKGHGVPKKVRSIVEAAKGLDEKTLLWEVILYQYAAIVRAQELMYVRDADDTRFLARGEGEEKGGSTTYEPKAAWDRHAAFMRAQSRAVATFNNSLKAYQQLAVGARTADTRVQQAKRQKANKLMEKQCPDINIHTHIPRPDGTNKEEL